MEYVREHIPFTDLNYYYYYFFFFTISLTTIQSFRWWYLQRWLWIQKWIIEIINCVFILFLYNRRRRRRIDWCSLMKKLLKISFWVNAASSFDFELRNSEVFFLDKSWRWPFSDSQTFTALMSSAFNVYGTYTVATLN